MSRYQGLTNRWWQLLACMVAMIAIANLQYTWTLFTVPLSTGLRAKLSDIQLAFTLFIVTQSWLVPVEGFLVDRLGARSVIAVGGLLIGLSWVGAGLANSLRALYAWYVLGGVGVGSVYGACVGTILKWFPDRRGLAAGLVVGAYGSGAILTILPIQRMIERSGYRATFIAWGIIQGVVVMVLARFMVGPPSSWKPGGSQRAAAGAREEVHQSLASYTPLQMLKTGTFHLMYLSSVLITFGGLVVTAQLKPIAATFVLFSAATGHVFGTQYAATNNGIIYTSKGMASIFSGWGAARMLEVTGSWLPVLWAAFACNLLAAILALLCLKPMVARITARQA